MAAAVQASDVPISTPPPIITLRSPERSPSHEADD